MTLEANHHWPHLGSAPLNKCTHSTVTGTLWSTWIGEVACQKLSQNFLLYPQHYTTISLYHIWYKWSILQLYGHSCNLGWQVQPLPAPPYHWRPRNLSPLSEINHWFLFFFFFLSPPQSLFLLFFFGVLIALSFQFAPGFTDNQELLPLKQPSSSIDAVDSSFYLLKVDFFLLPGLIMITNISAFCGLGW